MSTPSKYVVGISGGSGSGKTRFINDLFQRLPVGSVSIVSQDNYYLSVEKQQKDINGKENFDLPTSVDRHHFERDINRLLSDESITKLEYTFNNEKREPETIVVHPAPIIVTEGLFIFHYENIRKMIDLAIFIEAPNDVRLARRVRRDFEERGYAEDSVKYQWQNHVVPAEEQFLYPYKESADIIVDNTDSYTDELDDLVERLLKILNP